MLYHNSHYRENYSAAGNLERKSCKAGYTRASGPIDIYRVDVDLSIPPIVIVHPSGGDSGFRGEYLFLFASYDFRTSDIYYIRHSGFRAKISFLPRVQYDNSPLPVKQCYTRQSVPNNHATRRDKSNVRYVSITLGGVSTNFALNPNPGDAQILRNPRPPNRSL